tara:strand:+ start:323 stop:682 length:360 start_codon:yes stop_codon:yes gene_type:complete
MKGYVTMNLFYNLPDDLQEKIYRYAHLDNFIPVLIEIENIKHTQLTVTEGGDYAIKESLYNSKMDIKELEDYFFCIDWLEGKKLDIRMEDIYNNPYYKVFDHYWDNWAWMESAEVLDYI